MHKKICSSNFDLFLQQSNRLLVGYNCNNFNKEIIKTNQAVFVNTCLEKQTKTQQPTTQQMDNITYELV